MTKVEMLLSQVAEEGVEVAQRAIKAQRFGLTEIQPEQADDNTTRLLHEVADLRAVLDMLLEEIGHPSTLSLTKRIFYDQQNSQWQSEKRRKVLKYLEYSRRCGTLDEVWTNESLDDPLRRSLDDQPWRKNRFGQGVACLDRVEPSEPREEDTTKDSHEH